MSAIVDGQQPAVTDLAAAPQVATTVPIVDLKAAAIEANVLEVDSSSSSDKDVSDTKSETSYSSDFSNNDGGYDPVKAATSAIAPPPLTLEQKAAKLCDILERYRMNTTEDNKKHSWSGKDRVKTQIIEFMQTGAPIRMVLPAFPFKSPNKASKVLGTLPDMAEEVALQHMQGLCAMMKEVYEGGAEIHVVSDGLMYNDLLGVSDEEVWEYSTALRELAKTKGSESINFKRIKDLLGLTEEEPLTKESYLERAPGFRQQLVDTYLDPAFDVDAFIKNEPDATLTYRGYIKFLEKDLEPAQSGFSPSNRRKLNEQTAKRMMVRGKAFAAAIAQRFGDYIRLSIHDSTTDASKLPISLIPQTNKNSMTPWHSTLVRAVDGTISMDHSLKVPALTHELIKDSTGRPIYFREKSDLFEWPGMDVEFEYLYPTGMIIRPKERNSNYSLHNVHMQKVRYLAEKCSPIVLRGFKDTTDERTFKAKAYDAGEVLPWTFGIMQKVRDAGRNDRVANNVVSSEAMPMHYDGMFKFMPVKDEDGNVKKDENGKEITASTPPRFQYFTAITPSPPGSGYTLFASSRLFFQHLPSKYSKEKICDLRWNCKNSGFWDCFMTDLPLVITHPTTGQPCVRWHEPWPIWKTKFAHAIIQMENGSQKYINLVDSMLYDRRVCLYFTWEQGDVIVSDNMNMLHTRTAFEGFADRELWRIHFD